ncbi:hypothetical protein [Ruegeria sediminis]|uniref:hypothetical protein n=1 Tax=Ruegeria sediminis TaxID=2583820 RepID=UPI00148652AD|nr:hypothetical protein [Ruegeria sediminis]
MIPRGVEDIFQTIKHTKNKEGHRKRLKSDAPISSFELGKRLVRDADPAAEIGDSETAFFSSGLDIGPELAQGRLNL